MAAVPSIGRASLPAEGVVGRETAATCDLYERHRARIHGYCLRRLGSREEAEDAVQTTFMNAFGALRKGIVPESEVAWLLKIAENVCLSRHRSSRRRGRLESPADFGVIEELVAGPDNRRDELIGIEDALAAMPAQQRRAILLREWQGLSYREIAAELELSQAAVETLIFRARRSLAQGLTEPEAAKRKRRLRKALHLGDVVSFFAGLKALLGGGAAAQAAVAAVTVATVAGVTARPAVEIVPDRVKASPAPVVSKSVPAAPPAAPPARVVVDEPRQEPVSAPVRPAVAQPRAKKPPAPPPRVAPAAAAAAPARVSPVPADAPGRDVAAERQAPKAASRPATKPDLRPVKPAKPETKAMEKPAREPKANAQPRVAAPKPAAVPKSPLRRGTPQAAATPKPKPPTSRRAARPPVVPPVTPAVPPRGKPAEKEKELPEAAADAQAATSSEQEPVAEPNRNLKSASARS